MMLVSWRWHRHIPRVGMVLDRRRVHSATSVFLHLFRWPMHLKAPVNGGFPKDHATNYGHPLH